MVLFIIAMATVHGLAITWMTFTKQYTTSAPIMASSLESEVITEAAIAGKLACVTRKYSTL